MNTRFFVTETEIEKAISLLDTHDHADALLKALKKQSLNIFMAIYYCTSNGYKRPAPFSIINQNIDLRYHSEQVIEDIKFADLSLRRLWLDKLVQTATEEQWFEFKEGETLASVVAVAEAVRFCQEHPLLDQDVLMRAKDIADCSDIGTKIYCSFNEMGKLSLDGFIHLVTTMKYPLGFKGPDAQNDGQWQYHIVNWLKQYDRNDILRWLVDNKKIDVNTESTFYYSTTFMPEKSNKLLPFTEISAYKKKENNLSDSYLLPKSGLGSFNQRMFLWLLRNSKLAKKCRD